MVFARYGAATHVGHQRKNNEDALLCKPMSGLWAVADGMGGHAAGEIASAIAVNTLKKYAHTSQALTKSIDISHQAIIAAEQNGKGGSGMGSTVVAVSTTCADYHIAWVGDSRAYSWNDQTDELHQLTRDHSYVQQLLDAGAINEQERHTHPDKNVITQCLGSTQTTRLAIDEIKRPWRTGERLILCSDGLSDMVNHDQISDIMKHELNVQNAAESLVAMALNNGGYDNVTVIVVEQPFSVGRWIAKLFRNQPD